MIYYLMVFRMQYPSAMICNIMLCLALVFFNFKLFKQYIPTIRNYIFYNLRKLIS